MMVPEAVLQRAYHVRWGAVRPKPQENPGLRIPLMFKSRREIHRKFHLPLKDEIWDSLKLGSHSHPLLLLYN